MLKCLNMDKIKNGIVILSALLIKCQKYVGRIMLEMARSM